MLCDCRPADLPLPRRRASASDSNTVNANTATRKDIMDFFMATPLNDHSYDVGT
jgi:hypothetical protein